MARVIYAQTDARGEHGLAVGISRDGVHVTECHYVGAVAPAPYLRRSAVYTWPQYRSRYCGYWGDDGTGPMARRLVAGAISLLSYWGGDEEFVPEMDLSLP
jgi:hypothetical protein